MRKILLLLLLVIPSLSYGAAIDPLSKDDPNFQSVLNDDIQKLNYALINLNTSYPSSKLSGILATNQGGTGVNSSAWTSGDYVYMSSTGIWNHKTPIFINRQVFTSSGTFVAPASTTKVYLTACGGGGGGRQAAGGGAGGGGGGGGACVVNRPYTVIGGNSYTVTINAGGNSGTAGGTTVFDTLTLAGGLSGVASSTGASGAGSFDGGNTASFKGGTGATTASGDGGNGGGTIFGNGGVGHADGGCTGGQGGSAPANTGAGGGGGECNIGAGGNGGTGFVIVDY